MNNLLFFSSIFGNPDVFAFSQSLCLPNQMRQTDLTPPHPFHTNAIPIADKNIVFPEVCRGTSLHLGPDSAVESMVPEIRVVQKSKGLAV
jgi:hypothetical protein